MVGSFVVAFEISRGSVLHTNSHVLCATQMNLKILADDSEELQGQPFFLILQHVW